MKNSIPVTIITILILGSFLCSGLGSRKTLIHTEIQNNPLGKITEESNGLDFKIPEERSRIPVAASSETWDYDGVRIVNSSGSQNGYQIIADGLGGAYITWHDSGSGNLNIYAQHVNDNGDELWGENGLAICTAASDQLYPKICIADDGVFIIWRENRNIVTMGKDLYGQHIYSNGTIHWTNNGLALASSVYNETNHIIVSDEVGGFILAWTDDRFYASDNENDVFAQRFYSNGSKMWTAAPIGRQVCTAKGIQTNIVGVPDGNHGAIFAWEDHRNYASKGIDIYAQNSEGVYGSYMWETPLLCRVVCNEFSEQSNPLIVKSQEGVIIGWEDKRNYGSNSIDIYAQRFNPTQQWTTNGTMICNDTHIQQYLSICSDGGNGAYFVWTDDRVGHNSIYGQLINSSGGFNWISNGLRLSYEATSQSNPSLCLDLEGGIYCSWGTSAQGDMDILLQRFDNQGNPLLENGVFLTNAANAQSSPNVICAEAGIAITVWSDYRNSNNDIYCALFSNIPIVTSPIDQIGSVYELTNIDWTISDATVSSGYYRILSNCTTAVANLYKNWTVWTSGVQIHIPIDLSRWGNYYYQIEYYSQGAQYYGKSDTVIVKVTDFSPWTNTPLDFEMAINESRVIRWVLFDDFGIESYRVYKNSSDFGNHLYIDHTTWYNATPLYVPIIQNELGIFNYTIEFTTISGQVCVDSVVISIGEKSNSGNNSDGNGDVELLDSLDPFATEIALLGVGIAIFALLLALRKPKAKGNSKEATQIATDNDKKRESKTNNDKRAEAKPNKGDKVESKPSKFDKVEVKTSKNATESPKPTSEKMGKNSKHT